jgi:hypothetical protein
VIKSSNVDRIRHSCNKTQHSGTHLADAEISCLPVGGCSRCETAEGEFLCPSTDTEVHSVLLCWRSSCAYLEEICIFPTCAGRVWGMWAAAHAHMAYFILHSRPLRVSKEQPTHRLIFGSFTASRKVKYTLHAGQLLQRCRHSEDWGMLTPEKPITDMP